MTAHDEAIKEASRYYADMQGCNPAEPPESIAHKTEQIVRVYLNVMLARGQKMCPREATEEMADAVSSHAYGQAIEGNQLMGAGTPTKQAWAVAWDAAPTPGDGK